MAPSGRLPSQVESVLRSQPALRQALDEAALEKLARANLDRAVEVAEELVSKGDIRNPSAFVVTSLTKFPLKRGMKQSQPIVQQPSEDSGEVDEVLARYPSLLGALDAQCLAQLRQAEFSRASELIEEVANMPDVRNPSAFVCRALARFPSGRPADRMSATAHSQEPGVDLGGVGSVLDSYPEIRDALDERALAKIESAEPARVQEILQDVEEKGDKIRNVSAFVSKALSEHSQRRTGSEAFVQEAVSVRSDAEVERILGTYPTVRDQLDDKAISKLLESDPARVEEILQDVWSKGDIKNPSAFITKALLSSPAVRGHAERAGWQSQSGGTARASAPAFRQLPPQLQRQGSVEVALERHPGIAAMLDEGALMKLQQADPARAVEIIEEIAAKGDVRNPSAFVVKSMIAPRHQQRRGSEGTQRSTGPTAWVSDLDNMLASHPQILASLDEAAMTFLREADSSRAIEIIRDIAIKGDVRNPSAFVSKALAGEARQPRWQQEAAPSQRMLPDRLRHGTMNPLDRALASQPHLAAVLDEGAMLKLQEVDPMRAAEVINDMAARGDVRNPSAFVVKALEAHRQPRGHQEQPRDSWSSGSTGAPVPWSGGGGWSAAPRSEGPVSELDRMVASRHPGLRAALDEAAMGKLGEVELSRAIEILDDIAAKGDVRNPSAFVVKAIHSAPMKRGRDSAQDADFSQPPQQRPRVAAGIPAAFARPQGSSRSNGRNSSRLPDIDESARRQLNSADPVRAEEVLKELEAKGREVRNPSAFVSRSLMQYPLPRFRS